MTRWTALSLITLLGGCSGGEVAGAPPCPRLECDALATCDAGTGQCSCPAGYDDAHGDGTLCSDHDACAASPCLPGVACADHAAPDVGFTCGACLDGYRGDGVTCVAEAVFAAAAAATANSSTNACSTIGAFYWEIGDGAGVLTSGSVTPVGSPTSYGRTSLMAIASASKWIYSSYYVQRRNGVLDAHLDVPFLNFTSGHVGFSICLRADTVDSCLARGTNGAYTAASDGAFYYGGGHMQQHASQNGLGATVNATLAAEIESQLGADLDLAYSQPQPAGGIATTADSYARFLRKILTGELHMHDLLGAHAVCTDPVSCPTAQNTPLPAGVAFHYSLGHWVEDDPVTGDGAFSSAGAFGFYPWIDATRTYYGVLARHEVVAGAGVESLGCGRLIRAAYVTGVAQ